jgi:predicted MFS family arabinose efflux permease
MNGSNQLPDAVRAPLPPRRWRVVIALWLVLVFVAAYEIVPASLFPVIQSDLGIDSADASLLVSIQLLAMAGMAVPAGVVLDGRDDRVVMGVTALVLFVTTLANWYAGSAENYLWLLVSRFLAGFTIVFLWSASVNVAAAAFPPARKATAVGLVSAAIPSGFTLGQFLGPRLAAATDWTLTFPALGLSIVFFAGVFWIQSRGLDLQGTDGSPSLDEVRNLLTDPRILTVSVLAFLALSLSLFYNSWIPSYLYDEFGYDIVKAGQIAALLPAVGIVARAASGPVSDRLFDTRRKPIVLLSFLVIFPTTVGFGIVSTEPLLIVLVFLAGFFTQFGLALLYTYVRDLADPALVATALAAVNTFGFLGAFVSPVIAGTVIDRSGSYLMAFGYAALLAGLGIGISWRAPDATAK